MNNTLLYEYQNGNVFTQIYDDGTKIRQWPDDEKPLAEYPESCDLKITQYCDMDAICVYCFTPDTLIALADGSRKPIDKIEIGDNVISFNEQTGVFENRAVYHLFVRSVDEDIVVIEFEDGKQVKLTCNHRVYTQRGKIRADELCEDDEIVQFDKCTHRKIKGLSKKRYIGNVHNFSVSDNHNYIAESCLVGNCHEMSNKFGKHGDLDMIDSIWASQKAGTELAIGGGNPLAHPGLPDFLRKMKGRGIIPNVTVNVMHMKKFAPMIREFQAEKLIYGLGISYRGEKSLALLPKDIDYKNVVFHMIMGIHSLNDCLVVIEWCNSRGITPKVLLLGYKTFGNGIHHYTDELKLQLALWDKLYLTRLLNSKIKVVVSFDNLAISQLSLEDKVKSEVWDELFQGHDGLSTFYCDAVKQECARTSTSSERFPIKHGEHIVDVFNKVKLVL